VLAGLVAQPIGAHAQAPPPRESVRPEPVELTIFWEPGCPFCKRAKDFLAPEAARRDWLRLNLVDVTASRENLARFERVIELFGIAQPGVPLFVLGQNYRIGFDETAGDGRALLVAAEACREQGCVTFGELLRDGLPLRPEGRSGTAARPRLPDEIVLPWGASVSPAALSLPALTVVLAAIDGFNPCAMWVLVFLIGLLLGMQDRARMWLLGGTFLVTSGLVYFLFLAAWLNVFLVLGAVFWVRLAVGLVALASGSYYLYAFATDAAAECHVTSFEQRRRIMDTLRASVNEPRFLAALAGIVVLAAAVNLIELFCSAGIPAVYTDVLAMNDLPAWQHYFYLLLYVVVFMLDDAAIFAIAMFTLHASSMTNRYLRVSHLMGGLGMVAIGILLLFAPDWLTFAV
jgi:glutaredoxin